MGSDPNVVNLSPECWKFNDSGLIFWIFYINILTYPPKYVVYRLSNITLPAKYLSIPLRRRYAIWVELIFVQISSNPLKIISQIKLNWNPIGWKNILYGEENFHFCKLLFICSSLQKLPCSRIFHRSEKNLAHFLFQMFLNRHFPKPDSSLILHCSRNFITFLLICFTARSLQESCGRVIIFLQ